MSDDRRPLTVASYIAGQWRQPAPGGDFVRRDPMHPSRVVADVTFATTADIDEAVAAAVGAASGWARTPRRERAGFLLRTADVLQARREPIANTMATEMGKPVREARAEVDGSVETLRFCASLAYEATGEVFEPLRGGGQIEVARRPLGVVALITPWNFPCAIPVWKLGPALLCGNAAVVKVSEQAPLTGLEVARCFDEAGLPQGVLSVVLGDAEVGAALVTHSGVDGVSFTGSVAVGRIVRDAATAAGKAVQLELGGQNPMVVMSDAQLDRAVEGAYAGAFWSAGQKCTSTRRIYVQDAAYERFRVALLQRIGRGRVGDPLDPEVEVGPLVTDAAQRNVLSAIEDGRSDGGVLLGGGDATIDSYLVTPAVFEGLSPAAYLSRQEVFGPVVGLYRFDSLSEAIMAANDVEMGLSAAIYTDSLAAAADFVDQVDTGVIHVNSPTAGADVHVPFGGTKASALGPAERGRAALEFYGHSVTVYRNP